jgi:hypothetical protein
MKTKGRSGKLGNEAGMCVKTNDLYSMGGNVIEKKGGYTAGSRG